MKLALGVSLLLCLWASAPASAEDRERRQIAEHYAPVVFQESRSAVLDFITRFDYDGDWAGDNNWRNAYLFELPGAVYYSVVESSRHYFITYAFYHPRDYTGRPYEGFAPKTEHENDLEGCTVVVEKDGTPFGKLLLLETLAHDVFYKYANPDYRRVSAGALRLDGSIELVDGRPAVHIEAEGHGVKAAGPEVVRASTPFPGIVYRYTGQSAVPKSNRDPNATYDLIDIEDTFWARRFDVGSTFCCADPYYVGAATVNWGSAFNGPIGGCAAKPPWGWDQANDPIAKGDWFRDPLKSFAAQLRIENFTGTYVHNPYLTSDGRSAGSPCSESTTSKTVKSALNSSLLGIAKALTVGGLSKEQIGAQAKQLFVSDAPLLEWSSRGELEAWSWDKTLASLPSLITNGLRDELHVPLTNGLSFDSPVFKAPTRYFDSLVLNYRSKNDVRARVSWSYEGATDFNEAQSIVAALTRSETPKIAQVRLAGSKGWDATRTVQKIRITIDAADNATAGAAASRSTDTEQLVLSYLVFDRNSFSDTFER